MVRFAQENQGVVKKNPGVVKLICEHPEQVPILNKFTKDPDAIKNFLQSQVLVMQVAQDSEQGTIQALKDDPDLKHAVFGRVVGGHRRYVGQRSGTTAPVGTPLQRAAAATGRTPRVSVVLSHVGHPRMRAAGPAHLARS